MNSQDSVHKLLTVRNLQKAFGTNQVLRGISLDAASGERVLLCGGNGSGKTTLLRILAGVLRADDGSIQLSGLSWPTTSVRDNSLISWLPAGESGFWPRLSGGKALELYARLWRVDTEKFNESIASWSELPAFKESLDVPTFKLSTGRRQLLHLARILLHQPRVILADEPLRSLDEPNQIFALAQIEKFSKDSLLIVSSPRPLKNVSWSQMWNCQNGVIS